MKNITLAFLVFFCVNSKIYAQEDVAEISGKMNFPSDLPQPRFVIPFSDDVKGIKIVFEDLKALTKEKVDKLNKVEFIEFAFSNQLELDKEIEILSDFPNIKYIAFSDWKYGSELSNETIILPNTLANYKNIKAIRFGGDWILDYDRGLEIIKNLPNLQYLFFQNIKQPIPVQVKSFKQLKGISIHSSDNIDFPEWITDLSNLESISVGMIKDSFKERKHLNYYEVLNKLQHLPLLKSIYLNYVYKVDGDFNKIKFNKLEKLNFYVVDFNSNKRLIDFVTNQDQLKSLTLNAPKLNSLTKDFAKLKQLNNLSISGVYDSLTIDFDLRSLNQLKSLTLSGNKIYLNRSELPKNLIDLNLSSLKIATLPKTLTGLTKLKTLNISNNLLTFLPDDFSKLQALEYLDLSDNRIKTLPDGFKDLKALKFLKINANPIIALPENIGNLKNLAVLEVQHGNLSTIPESIGNLVGLENLDLSDNFINKIPDAISKLKRLKSIDLNNNQLVTLPNTIGQLDLLENMNLRFNNINRIPSEIGCLQLLKKVNLSYNDLESIPNEISALKSLEDLSLVTGPLDKIKGFNYERAIYRPDDPKPLKKITINNIKNFPEDLSQLKSIKKIDLSNNTEINTAQLFKGLFSIPKKGFSVILENCGISELPELGWENFYAKSLNLRDNKIKLIPNTIVNATYLTQLNLNNNRLISIPINLNQYVDNRFEKLLWFKDLGLISNMDMPKTDSMVLALINKSKNHYYRKEFQQSVNLMGLATQIDRNLAMAKASLTDLGEANYEVGDYTTAVEYLTAAIKKDTVGNIKIMNFIIPNFKFRAKSYLKLGDTLSAIKDYETLAENYSDSWGDVALLYKTIGKTNNANSAFENGLKKYRDQISYLKKTAQTDELIQLSLLELMIIKEDFEQAESYAIELEKELKQNPSIVLLRYLKACASIGNGTFNLQNKKGLEEYLQANKKTISRWSYELLYKWLRITKISKNKVSLIRSISDAVKP